MISEKNIKETLESVKHSIYEDDFANDDIFNFRIRDDELILTTVKIGNYYVSIKKIEW